MLALKQGKTSGEQTVKHFSNFPQTHCETPTGIQRLPPQSWEENICWNQLLTPLYIHETCRLVNESLLNTHLVGNAQSLQETVDRLRLRHYQTHQEVHKLDKMVQILKREAQCQEEPAPQSQVPSLEILALECIL